MIEKSERALEDAKALLDIGSYGASASRSYYAVFHILQSVLLTKNLSFSKHSGVIGGFSKSFIKEGVFPSDFANKIKKLWKNREIGDYDYEKKVSRDDAVKCIDDASLILDSIKKYIERRK
ncbi:hypothetical protein A2526_01425 [candidate division WOR-1 bacterium RIFOXYD2_FULL_36_8]|uniref:HEPN domain-containing protein n=1 Tax=candidate division WOR-1 bacterium RIFOXYB2_FULL_36_35 TaxID=1802578 RepID=A0A1F4S191_UNCSA|nr:MAG: hypothetical protein A2230_03600 [candidate division WOR-1 bacterium RIFOXYA2_FULL_36_21]OGC14198.1 MAG: hypothetical protein A2290_00710 [candidate division WOR-1 bacterium RIFOXYB2_FULL_36_35]OGC19061.1 MAG: hypothetical protein A2282_01900 [candidate division WOR-1 bacterium RIFOXYA12_FULL_36_13]OGC38722.1 MAG: hypothetical protein A2526_01425 [candidate division WOR-1 bacterium RIFOXYD2_FULL_36_8]